VGRLFHLSQIFFPVHSVRSVVPLPLSQSPFPLSRPFACFAGTLSVPRLRRLPAPLRHRRRRPPPQRTVKSTRRRQQPTQFPPRPNSRIFANSNVHPVSAQISKIVAAPAHTARSPGDPPASPREQFFHEFRVAHNSPGRRACRSSVTRSKNSVSHSSRSAHRHSGRRFCARP